MSIEQNSNPFDKRVLIAVAFFFVFYFVWQNHLSKKYPGYGKVAPVNTSTNSTNLDTSKNASTNQQVGKAEESQAQGTSKLEPKKTTIEFVEKFYKFESDSVEFQLSNKGMGLSEFKVKKYHDKDKNPIALGQGSNQKLFEMRYGSEKSEILFDIETLGEGHFIGRAQVGDMKIERILKYIAESASFSNEVKIISPNKEALAGVSFYIPEKIHTPESSSILFPSFEQQDFYTSFSGTSERVNLNHTKEDIKKEYKLISILSLGTQYFSAAILDKSEIAPEAVVNAEIASKNALAELIYKPSSNQTEFLIKQIFYAGPKSIDTLKKIDVKMAQLFDFGWMEWIAVPLLYTMKWFYSVAPNWGLAIILLTLFVRMIVLPFNIMSVRSMKAMQKIQPMITSLRERYKNDPLKLNQEMMALMKANKANPLGGCLPMLIQIPIFFALYRVIGSSIELYQSPFGLWIGDLSSHDKFYVLPVLMGLTMYIQQKITPTTMDPAQAKIMAFMPLIFSLFMLQLPSGLTLYMFVSALFGITQQWIMLRDKAS